VKETPNPTDLVLLVVRWRLRYKRGVADHENLPDNDPFDHRVFVDIAARAVMPFSRLRCGNPPTR